MNELIKKDYPEFNWEKYKEMNPYLYICGLRKKEEYIYNFLKEGRLLGRKYLDEHIYPYSIHVLIATIGNNSIFKMLECLRNELEEHDYLTIVFDASKKNIEEVKSYITTHIKGTVQVIYEDHNLGYWGHGIRNKYNRLKGDFIFHCDDDDLIIPGAFKRIRTIIKDKNTLYIFKIRIETGQIIWKTPHVKLNEISTQCGIIPSHLNYMSIWKHKYGGDYDFYKGLSDNYNTLFINELIYQKKIENKRMKR